MQTQPNRAEQSRIWIVKRAQEIKIYKNLWQQLESESASAQNLPGYVRVR